MADNNQILNHAHQLGTLVSKSPAIANYRELTRQLDLDITARGLVEQFEGLMEQLAIKEQNMQPIEIAEKQKLQSLQQSIAMHPLLKKLMAAQVEYSDLMRKVQESINLGMAGRPLENQPGQPQQITENTEAPSEEPPKSGGASKLIIP